MKHAPGMHEACDTFASGMGKECIGNAFGNVTRMRKVCIRNVKKFTRNILGME